MLFSSLFFVFPYDSAPMTQLPAHAELTIFKPIDFFRYPRL
jgi:hypothetical protein